MLPVPEADQAAEDRARGRLQDAIAAEASVDPLHPVARPRGTPLAGTTAVSFRHPILRRDGLSEEDSMTVPARYQGFWVPGLDHDIDRDESLRVGLRWLADAERTHKATGVIAMYAKSMVQNAPLLGEAARRWEFVSPRSRRPWGNGPVLAIWPPDSSVLEFAESLALDSAICVVAGHYDISAWVTKANATCLVEGFEGDITGPELSRDVTASLDAMLGFDGHNGFIGAGGKEDAIRRLNAISRAADRPVPSALEAYLLSSSQTSAKGADRARRWYEEILQGKRHRDYRGRII
jgi:hypothetical protein